MAVAARVTRDRSTTSSAAELVPRRGRRRLLDTASGRGAQHTLPFTEEQLVDSPFEQFAQMLAMPGLSESQLQLMKNIRRRGSRVGLYSLQCTECQPPSRPLRRAPRRMRPTCASGSLRG